MLYNIQSDDKKIKEILLSESYVDGKDMDRVEKYCAKNHVPIAERLVDEGLITKVLLGQAIAEYFKVSYVDLGASQPSREQVVKVPEELAKKYRAVLFFSNKISTKKDKQSKEIIIATDDPTQKGLLDSFKSLFAKEKITLAYSLPEDISASLARYRRALDTRFESIIKENKHIAPQLFEEMLKDALIYHASDIHLEPQEKEVLVRFRVDGMLQEAGRIPKQYYDNILNRIKVQANLRIDEHFVAQDGSIRYYNFENNPNVDLRVSIVPTLDGEKVVARLLSQYVQGFTLSDLGFNEKQMETLVYASKKPFGMIIVAGPTGSGKTTTLYALLKHINNPEINVTTIEDPVEYKITGVNQIQVNQKTNLTFAQGLRSIVRQDPDLILVGEIRDHETAEIAINAALTGHLMLSTFHANDAATSMPRLLDMGIEPFLLSSTLELIISQRLIRKVCEHCRYSFEMSLKEIQDILSVAGDYFSKRATFYKGKGCGACGYTGFKGRMAIFEFIKATPEIKDLVLRRPSTGEIWNLAREQGSLSLFEDGIEKVKNGISTLEELLRVAEPPLKKRPYGK